MDLYHRTVTACSAMLTSLLSEAPNLDSLQEILMHTNIWIESPKIHERERAIKSTRYLLKFVSEQTDFDTTADFYLLGQLVALLGLHIGDSVKEIGQTSAEAAYHLHCIILNKMGDRGREGRQSRKGEGGKGERGGGREGRERGREGGGRERKGRDREGEGGEGVRGGGREGERGREREEVEGGEGERGGGREGRERGREGERGEEREGGREREEGEGGEREGGREREGEGEREREGREREKEGGRTERGRGGRGDRERESMPGLASPTLMQKCTRLGFESSPVPGSFFF
ncbi:maestro heat-like repeat family member 5 [Crotalus adamanteus]|uniref:Maestro heat-like repeat family member 5 n=1 Tax=Crotalus adamanteus TaxID=8729 RepID=A0AAW1AQ41_CROAD